jgi:hypothetical protein
MVARRVTNEIATRITTMAATRIPISSPSDRPGAVTAVVGSRLSDPPCPKGVDGGVLVGVVEGAEGVVAGATAETAPPDGDVGPEEAGDVDVEIELNG